MKRRITNTLILLGASLMVTACGKKNFTQDLSQPSASPSATSEGSPAPAPTPGTSTTPTTTPTPNQGDLLAGDASIATIQWYDDFDWIPYVSDQDCVKKMKALVRAQTGDLTMMNFEIRHVTKDQLTAMSAASADSAQFRTLLLNQTTPIYGFYDGWINE